MPYKFTKAYDYRGSSMGRRACLGDRKSPVKLYLNKVRVDAGGYDSGGAYWGTGEKVGHLWRRNHRSRGANRNFRAWFHARQSQAGGTGQTVKRQLLPLASGEHSGNT